VATRVELLDPRDSFNALLRIEEELVEGAHYQVEMLDCGNTALTAVAEFDTGPTVPLPSALGTVMATEPSYQDFVLQSGGTLTCGRAVEGDLLEAFVELDPSTAPWSDLFQFQALVDGERWFDDTYGWVGGEPPPGPGGTRVYRLCDATSAESMFRPEPGPHELTLTAELPGVTDVFSTEAVTVELYCEGEEPHDSPSTPMTGAGGCSVSARAPGDTSALLLAALALFFAGRRPRYAPSRLRTQSSRPGATLVFTTLPPSTNTSAGSGRPLYSLAITKP